MVSWADGVLRRRDCPTDYWSPWLGEWSV